MLTCVLGSDMKLIYYSFDSQSFSPVAFANRHRRDHQLQVYTLILYWLLDTASFLRDTAPTIGLNSLEICKYK